MFTRPLVKRLSISMASLCIFLPLLEVGLRLSDFRHPPIDVPMVIWNKKMDSDLRLGRGPWRSDPAQLWTPRPGANVPWGQNEKVNAAGYRGPLLQRDKADGVLRIATLGDSSTFGMNVSYPQTYSAQLQRTLRADGHQVEVLDAGVVGFTVRQGIERYKALVRDFEPDIVVAAFGAVNEHFEAQSQIPDIDKIRSNITDQGLWTEIAHRFRNDTRLGHLAGKISDHLSGVTSQTRHEVFEKERFHHNLAQGMGEIEWPGTRRVSLDEFVEALDELHGLVEEDGAQLVLLSMPRKHAVEEQSPVLLEYTDRVLRYSLDRGVPLADGRSAFVRQLEAGQREKRFFTDNYHPSAEGHKILANQLNLQITPLLDEDNADRHASANTSAE